VVGAGWQKSGLNLKIALLFEDFAPWALPKKEVSTFFILIAKVRSSETFLCRNFLSNVFGLGSVAYEWTQLGFLAYA